MSMWMKLVASLWIWCLGLSAFLKVPIRLSYNETNWILYISYGVSALRYSFWIASFSWCWSSPLASSTNKSHRQLYVPLSRSGIPSETKKIEWEIFQVCKNIFRNWKVIIHVPLCTLRFFELILLYNNIYVKGNLKGTSFLIIFFWQSGASAAT